MTIVVAGIRTDTRLTRRSLLQAGGALAAGSFAGAAAGRVRGPAAPPAADPDALDAWLKRIVAASGGRARIETVGASHGGRPILMLSIGEGPKSALVVGGAHANEPIGGIAVCRLAEKLAGDPALLRSLRHRWQMVACIDPDGLAMNRRWLAGDRSPRSYLADFFRPSFERQPEYSFPIHSDGYSFTASTPENLAWQKALERSRPTLQVGLHNADVGGAFYLVSRDIPEMKVQLLAQPVAAGLTVNPIGEPFSDMPPLAPGLLGFLDIPGFIRAGHARGNAMWQAGTSSALYASEKYGTFNLVCEAPLWDDPRLRVTAISRHTMAEVIERHIARLHRLTVTALPAFGALPSIEYASIGQIGAALGEFARLAPHQLIEGSRLLGLRDWSAPLALNEFAVNDLILAFLALRPYALLTRYASAIGKVDVAQAARGWLEAELRRATASVKLRPVPVDVMVSLHVDAALTAASVLAHS